MRRYVKKLSQKLSILPREKLEEITETSFQQNDNLYEIIDSISTGLLILDNDFNILETNAILEGLLEFNCHLDDSKISNVPVWDLITDKEIADYIKYVKEKDITNSCEEFSTSTSGGSVRFLSITVNPLNIKNKLSGRIILITDITERKSQDVLLHRMENMANLTTLAAGMAHEIKNPLAAISIHMQLIEKAITKARNNQNILPEKKFVEEHISVVNEEIQHLNKLVMDFLFAVRPVNASLELKNPDELIKNIVSFFEAEFNSYGVKVEVKLPEKKVRLMLDEKLFRDVIINLAQNALAAIKSRIPDCNEQKFSDTDDKNYPGIFGIYCEICENKYLIKVKDNGCGMSGETLSKIFEPYYTTKANGTGLGMTMVYKIIKEFSGEIFVESEEGTGSVFTIKFPIPQQNKKLLNNH